MKEEKKKIKETVQEGEELGEWTKEMLKPQNLLGFFTSTEEMLRSMLED